MEKKKWRVVCYINQFFAQIGGEEMADVGFQVKETAVGPSLFFQSKMKEECDIVGTVICGDNYFAGNIDAAVKEGLELVKELKPDLFIAGPAFNAGRYGMSCGAMAAAVHQELGIPTISGMYPENPAVEIYHKNVYIFKTGILASELRKVGPKMADFALRLLRGETVYGAEKEGYMPRDIILNEEQPENAATRAINMVLAKIKGEPFVSELLPPAFDIVEPAPPVKDVKKMKLALLTDGGLIPETNPDKLKPNGSTTWGFYNWDQLMADKHFVIHSGYDGTWVLEDPNRLFPVKALREMQSEGEFAELCPDVFVTCGNCASVAAATKKGEGIAAELLKRGYDGAILTST